MPLSGTCGIGSVGPGVTSNVGWLGIGQQAFSGRFPPDEPQLVGHWDASKSSSVTVNATNRVSAWADQTPNGNTLLQGTTANQPLYLPWSGTNYGYLPKVNGNDFTTPNATANQIVNDIGVDIFFTWLAAPGGDSSLCAKWLSSQQSWALNVDATGHVRFYMTVDGSTSISALASVTVATTGTIGIRVGRVKATGVVTFYSSTNGVTYTLLGTPQTLSAGNSLFNSNQIVTIGGTTGTDVQNMAVYYMRLYNDAAFTSVVQTFNPTGQANNATSWTATTGEVWTVNKTAIYNQAQIVGAASVSFDGAAYKMAASFTLAQPCTIIFAGNQRVWTTGKYILDGTSANTAAVDKITSTPDIALNAGSAVATNTHFTLAKYFAVAAVFNGASSSLTVNGSAATTGNAGSGTPSGLTIGADGGGANFGICQFQELLVYNAALDTPTIALILNDLAAKWAH